LKTLVLMPTYNEISGLSESVEDLFRHNPDVSLLVIDDASPDGTGQLADQLASADPRIRVLHREGKQGLGKAYLAGYEYGLSNGYQRLVQMDADGSHRPEDLPALLESEADLVIGSRWTAGGEVQNWPKYREAISRFGNWYARFATGLPYKDLTAGYRVYSQELLKKMDVTSLEAQGYGFQVEMTRRAVWAGARIEEVPIVFVERSHGSSKMTYAIVFEAFWLCTKWLFHRTKR
jgi:dolichol-phosphate mannosyltransferase